MPRDGGTSEERPGDKVLVVDDMAHNRDLLARRLEKKGHSVLQADDGESALQIVAEQSVDVVLLDVMMPGISGLEVLEKIRADHDEPDLPVIMATAKSDSDDIVEALEKGADDYVTKPIDFPVLHARLTAVMARQRRKAADKPSVNPAAESEIVPGVILAGRYRVEERVGQGSFGAVFRARHQELERDVAIKVLYSKGGDAERRQARFRQEGVAACRVKHPNAVSIIDFATGHGGTSFLVMEFLRGHTLQEEMKFGALAPSRAAEIGLAICFALEEAHRHGIIHRDVKPANIFIEQAGRSEVPKVLDFGVAKMLEEGAQTATATHDGRLVGTPAYMAPERFSGEEYGPSSDVYSLGVVLYEAMVGRRPFVAAKDDAVSVGVMHVSRDPEPAMRMIAGITPEIEALIMACLSKNPSGRPSIEELATGLSASLNRDLPARASSKVELSTPPRADADVLSQIRTTDDVETEVGDAPSFDPRASKQAKEPS